MTRPLHPRLPAAVLFDFNGVLLDDEPLHWAAFGEALRPHGIRISHARYNARYLVYDDRTALLTMLRDSGLDDRLLRALLRRKRRAYARLASTLAIEPGAMRLVRAVARRVVVGVVSGAIRQEVVGALRRAGLEEVVSALVTAEDVKRPKPWPDGYRLALRRLGLKGGGGSLAIEDSPGGVRAARSAGLTVIGVCTTFPAAVLRRSGAAVTVPRLSSLTIADCLFRRRSRGRRRAASGRRRSRRRS